jgi:hypothetical protein
MIGEFVADSRLSCREMETLLFGRAYWPACTVGPKTTDTASAPNIGLTRPSRLDLRTEARRLPGVGLHCRWRLRTRLTPTQYLVSMLKETRNGASRSERAAGLIGTWFFGGASDARRDQRRSNHTLGRSDLSTGRKQMGSLSSGAANRGGGHVPG